MLINILASENRIMPWLGALFFFAAGLWMLLGARRLQRQAIEADKNLKFHPFRGFIRSKSYVTVARIGGASSILVAILLAVLVLTNG